ncbi:hypothetical protein DEIPH_ctg026orf0075 [Deinococcus phoenicis]|uniref:Uncharacterized protein n=1 Tax=Deinococcus phoenicis TaxID=1476583 RepID=A0A016QQA8_9DEIO|nr:hypothetical protein [Deinococcus phoenicis]EYB68166.1 hypothetical protein DEIPH_ctg026orf0075 [Deinococcus phoenicis]
MQDSQLSLSSRTGVTLIGGLTGGYPNPDDSESLGACDTAGTPACPALALQTLA